MVPAWLTVLAAVSLLLAGLCALVIVFDMLRGNRQHMWIMNIVWPVTALYAGPLALWAYFTAGRQSTRRAMQLASRQNRPPAAQSRPLWQSAGLAASHCGSGCTLGDLLGEGCILTLLPLTLWGHRIFAAWVVDYALAFLFGIAFQYFTITPMKQLAPRQGLAAALKADSLSLTAWQAGMYGWMAVVVFAIFGHELPKADPVFWFMMQLAMLAGFLTSYPVNWWLVKSGIKEGM